MKRAWFPVAGLIGLAVLALAPAPAEACTTFCLRDGGSILFGKNYDWHLGQGMLVVNPRHVERVA